LSTTLGSCAASPKHVEVSLLEKASSLKTPISSDQLGRFTSAGILAHSYCQKCPQLGCLIPGRSKLCLDCRQGWGSKIRLVSSGSPELDNQCTRLRTSSTNAPHRRERGGGTRPRGQSGTVRGGHMFLRAPSQPLVLAVLSPSPVHASPAWPGPCGSRSSMRRRALGDFPALIVGQVRLEQFWTVAGMIRKMTGPTIAN